MTPQATVFAPMLIIRDGIAAIEFYIKALGAQELRHWSNDDGSIHVAELHINGALFYLRQEGTGHIAPQQHSGVTAIHHLLTDNPDALFNQAIAAGATQLSPMQDFDYGYRQGVLRDPFGHEWSIGKKLV